jgi:hypothetical protein
MTYLPTAQIAGLSGVPPGQRHRTGRSVGPSTQSWRFNLPSPTGSCSSMNKPPKSKHRARRSHVNEPNTQGSQWKGWRDDPIKTPADDRLRRAPVAQRAAQLIADNHSPESSVVYGLEGPWGSGKCSVIALITGYLSGCRHRRSTATPLTPGECCRPQKPWTDGCPSRGGAPETANGKVVVRSIDGARAGRGPFAAEWDGRLRGGVGRLLTRRSGTAPYAAEGRRCGAGWPRRLSELRHLTALPWIVAGPICQRRLKTDQVSTVEN